MISRPFISGLFRSFRSFSVFFAQNTTQAWLTSSSNDPIRNERELNLFCVFCRFFSYFPGFFFSVFFSLFSDLLLAYSCPFFNANQIFSPFTCLLLPLNIKCARSIVFACATARATGKLRIQNKTRNSEKTVDIKGAWEWLGEKGQQINKWLLMLLLNLNINLEIKSRKNLANNLKNDQISEPDQNFWTHCTKNYPKLKFRYFHNFSHFFKNHIFTLSLAIEIC